jgi:hypothetical protein
MALVVFLFEAQAAVGDAQGEFVVPQQLAP